VVTAGSGRVLNTHSPQTIPPQLNTMNFPTQDEDRESIGYAYSKPIEVDTFIWVKQRMRLLELQGQTADRVAIFDEFYLHTPVHGF
jgi:hypothetical protein